MRPRSLLVTDQDEATQLEDGRMSLVEHLTELRKRLMISIGAIAFFAIFAWIFYETIFDFLAAPYCDLPSRLQSLDESAGACGFLVTEPLGEFSTRVSVVAYSGLAMAMPVVLWQIWQFVVPGLYPKERRYGALFVLVAFSLFAMGVSLAYWSIPRALIFLTEIGGDNFISAFSPKEYLNFAVKMLLAFGIGFQFPIVLIFLQLIDLVENETLRRGRRYAVVGIVVLVAVITPSGDPITLGVMSVPMYLFYEGAIAFGWWRTRRQNKAKQKKPQTSST